MNNPPTPFEKFEQLAKKVVRVPKKEVVKLEQKRKAKKKNGCVNYIITKRNRGRAGGERTTER